MKKLIRICLWLFVFILAPPIAQAQEKDDLTNVRINGYFKTEFNFFNSGNSQVFSPDNSKGSTFPSQETVSHRDRTRSFWRSEVNLNIEHRYAELWAKLMADSEDFAWPNSVGLDAKFLVPPLFFWTDKFQLGLHHYSAHNLVEERYGKGVSLNGLYASLILLEEKDHRPSFRIWGAYYLFDDKTSPFIFTDDARETRREKLGRLTGAIGIDVRKETEDYQSSLYIATPFSQHGVASIKNRLEVLYKVKDSILVGPFVEYNANFQRVSDFGSGEWALGPMIMFKF